MCIDYLFGIISNKAEIQALAYKKSAGWEAAAARSHCKSHDGTFEAAARTIDEIEGELEQVNTAAGIVAGEWEGEEGIEITDEELDEYARAILEQEQIQEERKRQAEITKLAEQVARLNAKLVVSRGGSA